MNSIFSFFHEQLAVGHFSLLLLALAFLGGIVMSLAPCNLAILPLVIGYVVGCSENVNHKLVLQLCLFVVGMSLVFTTIGIISALTGMVFISFLSPYWILFIASVILIFGLNMAGFISFNFPVLIKKYPTVLSNNGYLYAFLIGMIFALAATPCSTPILASIMAATSLSQNILMGALMLFLFSIGQSLIIILAGLCTSFLKHLKRINQYTEYCTRSTGWVFILFAAYLYYKMFKPFFV